MNTVANPPSWIHSKEERWFNKSIVSREKLNHCQVRAYKSEKIRLFVPTNFNTMNEVLSLFMNDLLWYKCEMIHVSNWEFKLVYVFFSRFPSACPEAKTSIYTMQTHEWKSLILFYLYSANYMIISTVKLLFITRIASYIPTEVLHLWALFLKTLCIFEKKLTIANFEHTSILWRSGQKSFQGTRKLQF